MSITGNKVVEVDGTIKMGIEGKRQIEEYFGFKEPWRCVSRMRIELATAGSSCTPLLSSGQGSVYFLAVSADKAWRMKIGSYSSTNAFNCRGMFVGQVNSSTLILYNAQSQPNILDVVVGQQGAAL